MNLLILQRKFPDNNNIYAAPRTCYCAFIYNNIILFWCIALCSAWFAQSCANVVQPSGGDLDKTPPQILASEPIHGTLNAHPTSISLLFNTFIAQRERVHQNLSITPPLKTEYSWFGKMLTIHLKESLDSNTTVLLSLGTDYTNWDGNKPETAYTLVFSTGAHLDSGKIRGIREAFASETNEGISAFLYTLSGILPDTLNPQHTKPKYKVQLGSKGTFEFPALSAGVYRLFLVRDEYRNDVIDIETDAFGTTYNDIILDEGGTEDVRVRLSPKHDNKPPEIFEVRHLSPRKLLVRWSEKIEASSLERTSWSVRDSLQQLDPARIPEVIGLHVDPNNPSANIVYLHTPLQDKHLSAAIRWKLYTGGTVRDSSGNIPQAKGYDNLQTSFFSATASPSQTDTLLPVLVRTILANAPQAEAFFTNAPAINDSTQGIPLQARIGFVFSSALEQNIQALAPKPKNIILENMRQEPISLRIAPSNQSNILLVEPESALEPNMWYSLGFQCSSLKSWLGESLKDSVVVLHFLTADPRDFGTVSGTLIDSSIKTPLYIDSLFPDSPHSAQKQPPSQNDSSKAQYVIILEAHHSSLQGVSSARGEQKSSAVTPPPTSIPQNAFFPRTFIRTLPREGTWEFRDIPPGSYTLSVYYDINGNNKYDYGSVFPYTPAERFYKHPTDIHVKARWTIENVTVQIP